MSARILAALVLAAPLSASAGEFWGVVNLASYHVDAAKPMNERNPGLGIEYAQSPAVTYMLGAYKNSHSRASVYAMAAYTPVQAGGFSFGAAVGAASGYPDKGGTKTLPVVAGLVRWRGERVGANLLIIPKTKNAAATIGAQVVFRF